MLRGRTKFNDIVTSNISSESGLITLDNYTKCSGNLSVTGNISSNKLIVGNISSQSSLITLDNNTKCMGNFDVTGNISSNKLIVGNISSQSSLITLDNNTKCVGNFDVTGNISSNKLIVGNISSQSSLITLDNNTKCVGNFDVTGNISSNKLIVGNISSQSSLITLDNNTKCVGNFDVTGSISSTNNFVTVNTTFPLIGGGAVAFGSALTLSIANKITIYVGYPFDNTPRIVWTLNTWPAASYTTSSSFQVNYKITMAGDDWSTIYSRQGAIVCGLRYVYSYPSYSWETNIISGPNDYGGHVGYGTFGATGFILTPASPDQQYLNLVIHPGAGFGTAYYYIEIDYIYRYTTF